MYKTYEEAEKEKELIKRNGIGVGKIYDLDVIEVMVVFKE